MKIINEILIVYISGLVAAVGVAVSILTILNNL